MGLFFRSPAPGKAPPQPGAVVVASKVKKPADLCKGGPSDRADLAEREAGRQNHAMRVFRNVIGKK